MPEDEAAQQAIDAEPRAWIAAMHAGEPHEDMFTREWRTGGARQGWSEAWTRRAAQPPHTFSLTAHRGHKPPPHETCTHA